MDFRISNKHFHDYRPINEERSKLLDKMLNELKKCLPTANYIIGGGNAIPLLLRVYHKSISKTHNTDRADKIIESWIPPNVKYINGSYRDSNFVPHIICTEDNLEILVREADKAKMTLERRPKDVTIWPRIKLENYQATTIEEIKKRSKDGTRDILSSNSLRLVDMKAPNLRYFDLFVHHYKNEMGEKVIGTPDKIFKTESGGQNVKSENVIVESNKDQGEKNDKGLTVPFESFQPILYVFGETTFKIANPKYLFALKERHFRKKQDDTRDPIDIEVLHNILLYLKMDPMERIRNGT